MISAKGGRDYEGMVLVGFEGPGNSCRGYIEQLGNVIPRNMGHSFGVLVFDSRGIGASVPSTNHFDTDARGKIWVLQESKTLLNTSAPRTISLARARKRLIAERCITSFVNTASVARDNAENLGQKDVAL